MVILPLLLILWAALAVLGILVKSLLWLTIVGVGFFIATALAGAAMIGKRR